tara:strand:+ start:261 stop:716 length:456 start_codon:yes stop_codon:yes gene_type:complete
MPIAIRNDKVKLSSEKKTEELANKFLDIIKLGDIIFLYGEMGVGKTTFIRYFINGLQKKNKEKITEITSPTFNLLNEYKINNFQIMHYDLFRLSSSDELKNLNLFENKLNAITLIEWPQIIKEKPKNLIELTLNYEKDHQERSAYFKGIKI